MLLYKLARAAVDAQLARDPARREIVVDSDNFPTDRYVLEGIANERGMRLRWIEVDTSSGVTPEHLAEAVGPETALVVLSHVAYRSAYLAEAHELTRIAHDAGALVLWDLCHSAGSVPVMADLWGFDLAVGCTYKYLNGGPGSPAFAYVRDDLQGVLSQPIQGWMGTADVFAMGPEYEPGERHPSLPQRHAADRGHDRDGGDPRDDRGGRHRRDPREVGRAHRRSRSRVADEWLAPLGVTLASPLDAEERGGHVTLQHPAMREVTARLWQQDVIPDYRDPGGLRLGLSPLSTSFEEVHHGLAATRDTLKTVLTERAGLA